VPALLEAPPALSYFVGSREDVSGSQGTDQLEVTHGRKP